MPQLSQFAATYASQIFWLLVIFGLIYFTIGRGMVPKIEATVEARDARIAADLEEARRARAHADALEEEWRQKMESVRQDAQQALASAKARANAEAEARLKKVDAELASAQEAADARIAEAREQALAGVETAAADAAREIAQRIAGLKITPGEAVATVQRALAQREAAHG